MLSNHDLATSGSRAPAAKPQRPQTASMSGQSQSSGLWQHPYVDVFKHFKVIPGGDWRANKKQGDVQEIFAKEIGRKALNLQGSISANNFVQVPHPQSLQKGLNLTGRYLQLQLKSSAGAPFSLHFDFGMAERGHGMRLSVSNLFKSFNSSSSFVIQVPLDLRLERWTVVVLDIVELLHRSQLFPTTYGLEGAHSLKSVTLCASVQIRGVYTSDNEYDFVTLPSDLRFKFPFDNSNQQLMQKWPEYFDWQNLPGDWGQSGTQSKVLRGAATHNKVTSHPESDPAMYRVKGVQREQDRQKMSEEIDQLLNRKHGQETDYDEELERLRAQHKKASKVGKLPDVITEDDNILRGFGNENFNNNYGGVEERRELNKKQGVNLGSLAGKNDGKDYVSGQYCGLQADFKRSPKLQQDPIIELKHIIGYSPDRCLNLHWSRYPNDPNVVLFTSGATLIAMDLENNQQKRFFFGHSSPICCFDVNANGQMIASAQEGKNSIIRIWEYTTGRCISMMTMPVQSLKCLAFSYDGKYLACVGKSSQQILEKTHNKELIMVWDITRIGTAGGGKPEMVAKKTSDYNILALKFSPIDSSRMASCGKENIRFWRIKDNGSIRGSAVVLNHHARNTVFTCLDFEYGLRSMDPKENEALKRLFVGSKHGMVFQINYHTESLEATYQTNDSAIYGISVNEAFCVTGSEDTYLRVWPLDFSEFFMEAKHEGTVGAVEISPDGLKVVCGTLNGSLGILDKSNQRYKTFLRSHTDQILSLDYHLGRRIVITASKDKTIRLWDLASMDQVYEFSSPVDQALCVTAHPTLPLFSCGFESGTMRVFDIERTCVADEFCQFNKPVQKIAYSPNGDLLVTCCLDGGVAIHNPRRQHLPIKMLHLEFPPEFVHVAFTQSTAQSGSQNLKGLDDYVSDISANNELQQFSSDLQLSSKFAVMGDYGNCVNIYDSVTLILSHQIQCQHQIRQFQFANNNRELVVMTADCRIRFYSLARYEGILLREVTAVHRGNITAMNVSSNSGYMLTGGEDSMLKVWDYEANKTLPYYFQAFIGHSYPLRAVMFCPSDNSTIISCGDKDGIYIWSFYGDVRTQFAHQAEEPLQLTLGAGAEEQKEFKKSKSGSVLERLRISKKEAKAQQQQHFSSLKEGTFIVPAFKTIGMGGAEYSTISSSGILDDCGDETSGNQQQAIQYQATKREKGLTYNHFANAVSGYEIELQPQLVEEAKQAEKIMKPSLVNGYDGFGGVHDNLVWNQQDGWVAYTLHNKVIFETVKTREQTILSDSASQLSTIVLSADKKLLAVGEGRPHSRTGNSLIYLYDTQERKLIQRYTFHQRGVQALAFSNNAQHLISVGVQGENNLAIWDLQSGLVVRSCLIRNTTAVNAIAVDPFVNSGEHIQFAIVGNEGLFNIYRFEVGTQMLQNYEVEDIAPEFKNTNFTTLTYSQSLNNQGTYQILLGANDGSMQAYDPTANEFLEACIKKWVISGEIGHARCANHTLVVASSSGSIARFGITLQQLFPADNKQVNLFRADGPIVSLAMDELNNEGIAGTTYGTIYYINFNEKLMIKILSKAYSVQKPITQVKFNEQNPQLIISNVCCSDNNGSGIVKVWTSQTLDQVMRFAAAPGDSGPVSFVLSGTNGGKFSVIGHQGGFLRLVNIDCLKVDSSYRLPLQSPDELLTAAVFNPNGINIAVGTSHGNIYLGSIREDQQGRPKVLFGRLDINGAAVGVQYGITSLQFSDFDPIGSFLVSYENGVVKTWQSSVRNEQFLKLLELQQHGSSNLPQFDIAECGYQQFDLLDIFNMFENPHGIEEVSEDEKQQLKFLYQNKRYRQCGARFSPSKSSVDIYFSFVSALQYIYVRNYVQGAIVKRVSLLHFPTCFALNDYNDLFIEGSAAEDTSQLGGEQVLALVGTKEGKVLTYNISSSGNQKLAETRGGLSYGAISALDVSTSIDKIVAATESGELFTADIVANIMGQQSNNSK